MHEPNIDFSVLDPSRNGDRWNGLVESLATRAFAEYQQRLTVGRQLLAWSRPVFAIAATVTLVLGVKAWLGHDDTVARTRHRVEPAYVLATWAARDERPATENILQVLGAFNGRD